MKSVSDKIWRAGQKATAPTSKRAKPYQRLPHGCVQANVRVPLEVAERIQDEHPGESLSLAIKNILIELYTEAE